MIMCVDCIWWGYSSLEIMPVATTAGWQQQCGFNVVGKEFVMSGGEKMM